MGDVRTWAEATRRAACAVIETVGGVEIQLRIPAPPAANDDGEELGLRTPGMQVKPVSPAAVIRKGNACTVLVPAGVLEEALALSGVGAVKEAMLTVSSVVIGDQAYLLTDCEPDEVSGAAYLYRLVLAADAQEVV